MSNETPIGNGVAEHRQAKSNRLPTVTVSFQSFGFHEVVIHEMFHHIRQRLMEQASVISDTCNVDKECAGGILAIFWGCQSWVQLKQFIDDLESVQLGYATLFTFPENQLQARRFELAISRLNVLLKIKPFEISELGIETRIHQAMTPPDTEQLDLSVPYADDSAFVRKLAASKGVNYLQRVIQSVALRTSRIGEDTPISEDFVGILRQMHRFWNRGVDHAVNTSMLPDLGTDLFTYVAMSIFDMSEEQVKGIVSGMIMPTCDIGQCQDIEDSGLPLEGESVTLLFGNLKSFIRYLKPQFLSGVQPGTGAPTLGACLGHLPDDALITISLLEDDYLPTEKLEGDVGIYVYSISVRDPIDVGMLATCSAKHSAIGAFNSVCHEGLDELVDLEGLDLGGYSEGYTFAWPEPPLVI